MSAEPRPSDAQMQLETEALRAALYDERDDEAYYLIEELFKITRRRDDPRARTENLREHFLSSDSLFSASAELLQRTGVHPTDALLLSNIRTLKRIVDLQSYGEKPQLARLYEASPYLIANFFGLKVERFHLFCLDARGRLKAKFMLQQGTADCALFDLRRLLECVVSEKPAAVVISHNHPMGTLRPSQDDIDCTYSAIRALQTMQCPLLDHVIVAGDRAISLRSNGFVPAQLWLGQKPEDRLLLNWLAGSDEA